MPPRLLVLNGPCEGLVVDLPEGSISIGRDRSNAIHLDDASISRRHCLLHRESDSVVVRDLGSRNGIFLGETRVEETQLAPGDVLRVGRFELLFRVDDEAVRFASEPLLETIELRPRSSPAARDTRTLRALLDIGAEIAAMRAPEQIERHMLEEIFALVPADLGAVVYTEGPADLSAGLSLRRDGQRPEVMSVSRTVVERVLRRGVALTSSTADAEFRDAASLVASGSQSLLAAPLVALERVFGVVYLTTNDPTARFSKDELRLVAGIAGLAAAPLDNARYIERLERENRSLRSSSSPPLVGTSAAIREIERFVAKVAATDATVLIVGESGTGKEVVARAIHASGSRADRPFVAVNCAALAETLLESELFGHERGAFTGAIAQRKGKLEAADGGTIFFDEIGEMSPALQAKLLRVLQEREFERVGGSRTLKVDVRVLAATNRDLDRAVAESSFRQDLLYRLDVVRVVVPPLRERREDIPLLTDYFLGKFAAACKRRIAGTSKETRDMLAAYDWPGNVRELANAVERAVVLGTSATLTAEDLPETVRRVRPTQSESPQSYHEALREARRRIVADALERSGGSYTRAAALLGIHRNNLHRMARELGVRSGNEERSA